MHIINCFMTTQFLIPKRDVSILVATAGVKSNQKKMQVIHIGHTVYINKINDTPQIVLLYFNDFLIKRKI